MPVKLFFDQPLLKMGFVVSFVDKKDIVFSSISSRVQTERRISVRFRSQFPISRCLVDGCRTESPNQLPGESMSVMTDVSQEERLLTEG